MFTAKPKGYCVEDYTVERTVDKWIEEREQDGINNVKAVYLTKRCVMPWLVRLVWKGGSREVRGLVDGNTFRLKKWNAGQWSPNFYGK
jgi:hypothetical protein